MLDVSVWTTASPHLALHPLGALGQPGSTGPAGHEPRHASPRLSQALRDRECIAVVCVRAERGQNIRVGERKKVSEQTSDFSSCGSEELHRDPVRAAGAHGGGAEGDTLPCSPLEQLLGGKGLCLLMSHEV